MPTRPVALKLEVYLLRSGDVDAQSQPARWVHDIIQLLVFPGSETSSSNQANVDVMLRHKENSQTKSE